MKPLEQLYAGFKTLMLGVETQDTVRAFMGAGVAAMQPRLTRSCSQEGEREPCRPPRLPMTGWVRFRPDDPDATVVLLTGR